MLQKAISICMLLFFFSCAHHRDVRPGVQGAHSVQVKAEDTEGEARDAIGQAQHFCEKRNKDVAFMKEDKKYTGSMDEENYKKVKTAGKVAGAVGLGGVAANAAAGKGYTVEMQLKCI